MLNIADTAVGMVSTDYKERFIAEYTQLLIRYRKLYHYIQQIECEKYTGVAVPHDSPMELLNEQLEYMNMYLEILQKRAIIEGIDITGL